MTCVTIYISGYIAGRFKNGLISWLYFASPFCACMIWKGAWLHRALPLWGYYLVVVALFGAPYVLILALASGNVAGGGTKKAICSGMIFVGYNAGNIVGGYSTSTRRMAFPHTPRLKIESHSLFAVVLTPEAHIHSESTWIAIIVCMCCEFVLNLFVIRLVYLSFSCFTMCRFDGLRYLLAAENRKRGATGAPLHIHGSLCESEQNRNGGGVRDIIDDGLLPRRQGTFYIHTCLVASVGLSKSL